jgi:hypothetical protein
MGKMGNIANYFEDFLLFGQKKVCCGEKNRNLFLGNGRIFIVSVTTTVSN